MVWWVTLSALCYFGNQSISSRTLIGRYDVGTRKVLHVQGGKKQENKRTQSRTGNGTDSTLPAFFFTRSTVLKKTPKNGKRKTRSKRGETKITKGKRRKRTNCAHLNFYWTFAPSSEESSAVDIRMHFLLAVRKLAILPTRAIRWSRKKFAGGGHGDAPHFF